MSCSVKPRRLAVWMPRTPNGGFALPGAADDDAHAAEHAVIVQHGGTIEAGFGLQVLDDHRAGILHQRVARLRSAAGRHRGPADRIGVVPTGAGAQHQLLAVRLQFEHLGEFDPQSLRQHLDRMIHDGPGRLRPQGELAESGNRGLLPLTRVQRRLDGLEVGDVVVDADNAQRPAVGIAHHGAPCRRPAQGGIGAAHAELGSVDGCLPGEGFLQSRFDAGHVGRMHQGAKGVHGAAEAARRQAELLLEAAEPGDPAGVDVPVPGVHARCGRRQAQPRLAFAQRLLLGPPRVMSRLTPSMRAARPSGPNARTRPTASSQRSSPLSARRTRNSR